MKKTFRMLGIVLCCYGTPLIAEIVSGLLISLIKTLFQVQDQTLPFAVKLVSVAVVLSMMGGWIGSEISELMGLIFRYIPDVGA